MQVMAGIGCATGQYGKKCHNTSKNQRSNEILLTKLCIMLKKIMGIAINKVQCYYNDSAYVVI